MTFADELRAEADRLHDRFAFHTTQAEIPRILTHEERLDRNFHMAILQEVYGE